MKEFIVSNNLGFIVLFVLPPVVIGVLLIITRRVIFKCINNRRIRIAKEKGLESVRILKV